MDERPHDHDLVEVRSFAQTLHFGKGGSPPGCRLVRASRQPCPAAHAVIKGRGQSGARGAHEADSKESVEGEGEG